MAYMSQDRKRSLAPQIKAVLKKYGVKGSIAVHHSSGLVVNIKSGPIDFIRNVNETMANRLHISPHATVAKDHLQVNPYWYHEHYSGTAKAFLTELVAAMNVGNHDRSDLSTNYHDVGWYIYINVGKWNKPYVLEE
jgi:hypothetical protein